MTSEYIKASTNPEPHFNADKYLQKSSDPEIKSDDDLIACMRNGDSGAFAQLIERHQRFCMSKAYSILRNHGDAEDEVQNAWVQVWTHLDSYKGQGAFGAWLNRIVSNQCLMRLRKARLAPMTSVDQIFESKGTFRLEIIDQRALPEQLVGDDQVLHLLRKEIQRVPVLLREILVMRDVGQRVMQDVSADLGITVPAAKSRLMRARIELKQRMEKHYGERGRSNPQLRKARGHQAAYVKAN